MFREILTERLVLRCLQAADADILFEYRSHPEVSLYQSWAPRSLQEASAFIKEQSTADINNPGWYQIGIALQSGGNLIGDCGVRILESDARIAEIAITVAPASQSRGYATEALHAILELLFASLGKHRVYASVDPDNLRSLALMKRIGLRQEGHFVQSLWFKDRWADDVVFAMLASEWHHNS